MSARWEIVQTSGKQPFHGRIRYSNGLKNAHTENYARRSAAVHALSEIARDLSPTRQIWLTSCTDDGVRSAEIRYGSEGHDTYSTAHVIHVAFIDERAPEATAEGEA